MILLLKDTSFPHMRYVKNNRSLDFPSLHSSMHITSWFLKSINQFRSAGRAFSHPKPSICRSTDAIQV